jgi:predicted restriction endonuclease
MHHIRMCCQEILGYIKIFSQYQSKEFVKLKIIDYFILFFLLNSDPQTKLDRDLIWIKVNSLKGKHEKTFIARVWMFQKYFYVCMQGIGR